MSINSKRKGARAELQFAKLCTEQGYKARRTAQYCGSTGDAADVIGLPYIHIECKAVEKLNLKDAYAQAKRDSAKSGKIPIVAHKRNYGEWMITMSAEDWFKLYREWEAGHNGKEGKELEDQVDAEGN